MNKVKIIIDSTADLTPEYIKENDIVVVGLGVNFENEEYIDGLNITPSELFSKVDQKNKLPKTSAVPISTLIEVFKKYVDEGYDIFYTGISSKMSSSYNNAVVASQEFDEGRVVVYDSYNLSTGIGLQVLEAVRLKNEGKSALEIKDEVEKIKLNVRSQFMAEKLDYLYKGGRCSSVSYLLGVGFRIKPIIRVKEGSMIVYKKSMGNPIKALNVLLEIFKKDLPNIRLGTVMITSTFAPEHEKYLYEQLSQLIDPKHIMITHAGCVISSHCGPKTIGILYILKENID